MAAAGSSISAPVVIGTPPERPFSWRFTAPLSIGSALNPINSSLLATALVPIAHGLGVSIGQTAALVTALYLASAIAQPTAGKAAEVFGPRRVFLAGIGLVMVGGPRPLSTARRTPSSSAPLRACCAPPATSARSPLRPSPASSSTPRLRPRHAPHRLDHGRRLRCPGADDSRRPHAAQPSVRPTDRVC
jgi:Major Facilitator Superfamily